MSTSSHSSIEQSSYASVHDSAQIHEALEAARAHDLAGKHAAGSMPSPEPLSTTQAPAVMLEKFARTEALAPPSDSKRRSPSPKSLMTELKTLSHDHQFKAHTSYSSSTPDFQPSVFSSSVAFTKWLHLQHKYETCTDSMSSGLANEDTAENGALGKRARSEETAEGKESAIKAASPASSDEASSSQAVKIAKTSEPVPSPMHSVSKASLEDMTDM